MKILALTVVRPLCGQLFVIRPLCGCYSTVRFMDKNFNRFCGPSSLWTAFYRVGDPSSLWRLHHLLKMSSSLWTYFTVMVTRPLRGQAFFSRDDPSTLWRLYRPVYGLVKYFHRLGGPSTLWTVLLTRW